MFCGGNKKRILSLVLLLIGTAAFLSLLPTCVWIGLIGLTLIVIAILIFRSC